MDQGFLLQLELFLAAVQPAPSGCERVSALISCLTGKALVWANAIWGEEGPTLDNYVSIIHLRGERRGNVCSILNKG
jgi:hypothetical protein